MPATASGGVQPLRVSIQITTTGARAAANSMQQVSRSAAGLSRGMNAGVISTRTLGDAMRMSATLMRYTVAGAFMKVGTAAIQASRAFELSFSRIRGLTGMGADAVEDMKKGVMEMATETTRGPQELADALYFITSAGLRDASVAMDVLRTSAKAAAAGMGETADVSDAVTSAMNAYGQSMLSAGAATDIMVAAVREGKAEADTFAPAFSKVLPVASAFGASFNDISAAMAALTRTGMTAGTAGIYVRQVLSQLLKPSKQAQEALTKVGTSAAQIRTEVQEQGLFAALQNLSTKIGGIANAEEFARIFGNVRALTAVLQLVGPAAAENAEIFERLQNSTGDLNDAFGAYEDTADAAFNRARSSAQTSLIVIGDAVKPVITSLLELSTQFTKLAASILSNPIAQLFIKIGSGATLAIVALSAFMKTSSAIVRLFSNMSIVLTGTQYQYNATTGQVYKLTAATTQQVLANMNATTTTGTWTVANGFLAASIRAVSVALSFMNKALMAVAIVISVLEVIKFFKNKKEETDSVAESVGKLNEVLDETVKYGKSNLMFKISTDIQKTKLDKQVDRLIQQFKDQSPQFMENVRGLLFDLQESYSESGRASGVAYVKSLMDSVFGGVTGETKKALIALFQRELRISPEEWASATVPETTGDAVADAIIYSAISGARLANKYAASQIKGDTFDDFAKAIEENMFEDAYGQVKLIPSFTSSIEEFGKGFTDAIQETGSLAPFLGTLQEMEKRGLATGEVLSKFVGGALSGLDGQYELVGESAGNFADIINNPKNGEALVTLLQNTIGEGFTSGDATNKIIELREQMANVPSGVRGVDESYRILAEGLSEYVVEADKADAATEKRVQALEAEAQAINDVVEEYESQTSVIKELDRVQRGLLGTKLSQIEAERDLLDEYDSLAKATKESSGSFSTSTVAGSEAQEQLQKTAQSVMDLANTYAALGDDVGAGEVFAAGLADILRIAQEQGGAGGLKNAEKMLEEMGFTGQMYRDSLVAAAKNTEQPAVDTGKNVAAGIARGIQQGQDTMSQALVNALNNVLVVAKSEYEIESPSKRTAREIGKPMAQGIETGFTKYASSSKFNKGISNALNGAIMKAQKAGGRKGLSKFFADFLERKSNVESPAKDFVEATIGRMKDIIGSLGDYINSQLNFRKAQADLAKLINMQRGLDDRRRRAAREQQYAETRFGAGGGAEVTGYEQARIDQLQLDFERVSRDYAMGRATYIDLVDAEIALNEARASASEVNDDVIGAQNDFIDATVDVENRNLELASATVNVLEAYQDVQEAAANLYINHKELAQVYDSLAKATGIASGKLVVGSKELTNLGDDVKLLGGFSSTVGGYVSTLGNNLEITGQKFRTQFEGPNGIFSQIVATGSNVTNLTKTIGFGFTELSRGLIDPDSQFMKDIKSLPGGMWEAIKIAAQDAIDQSPLNLHISLTATVDGDGVVTATARVGGAPRPTPRNAINFPTGQYIPGVGGIGESPILFAPGRAVGGPVDSMKPYMVGERGPEMFIPKVSGTIVTTNALERYTRTRDTGAMQRRDAAGNSINVVVNNPVPQAAEESITRRMKVLSNSGLFG